MYRRAVLRGLAFCFAAMTANAESLLIVHADPGSAPVAQMMGTGKFTSVSEFNVVVGTPTLAALSAYDAVLAYTNFAPNNPTALGNVLSSYYALGGKALTLATFAFTSGFEIGGAIKTGPNAGLTNVGVKGNVSGVLVPTVPGDPIFSGINLGALTYFKHPNFAHPGVAPGATLLATDGAGHNMIARSANGIIDVNLFPGRCCGGNNAEFYKLLANTLTAGSVSAVPEPSSVLLLLTAAAGFAVQVKRRLS